MVKYLFTTRELFHLPEAFAGRHGCELDAVQEGIFAVFQTEVCLTAHWMDTALGQILQQRPTACYNKPHIWSADSVPCAYAYECYSKTTDGGPTGDKSCCHLPTHVSAELKLQTLTLVHACKVQ